MGSEAEASSTPKLPLFSLPHMQSPEPSGMLTPPLQTIASVPFRWEEEPGKPRNCTTRTTITNSTAVKCLDLPPRLFTEAKITQTPSPTTVLEGPYMGRPVFQSSSFRIWREGHGWSFGSSGSPERGQLGTMVLSKKLGHKERGLFASWGRRTLNLRGKRDQVGGGSYVFSSSMDWDGLGADEGGGGHGSDSSGSVSKVKMTKIGRSGSFRGLSHAKSHLWATIYEGLKQVIPWKGRKLKKDKLVI